MDENILQSQAFLQIPNLPNFCMHCGLYVTHQTYFWVQQTKFRRILPHQMASMLDTMAIAINNKNISNLTFKQNIAKSTLRANYHV